MYVYIFHTPLDNTIALAINLAVIFDDIIEKSDWCFRIIDIIDKRLYYNKFRIFYRYRVNMKALFVSLLFERQKLQET